MIKILTAAAAAAFLAGTANAAITVTSTPGPTPGQTLVETFDAPAAAGFSFSPLTPGTSSSSGVFSGSQTNVYRAPAGDTTNYFAALGGKASGTLTSTSELTSLSVEIGSVDTFNTISFYDGATEVGSLTGSQISPATVGQTTTAYYDFTDTSGSFDKVVFSSSQNSLEIDNIGVSAAPEPSTWALMFAGVAMIGSALRLGRRRQDAFAQA